MSLCAKHGEVHFDGKCSSCEEENIRRIYGMDEPTTAPEYTGGSVSYYSVAVESPTTVGIPPYVAECNDIIEALGMNYAEGNAFKALWRRCAARSGKAKKGYSDGLYDAEKVVFFGQRLVAQEQMMEVTK